MKTLKTFAELQQLQDVLGARMQETTERIAQRGARRLSDLARAKWEASQNTAGGSFGQSKVDGHALTLKKTGKLEHAATTYEAIGTSIRMSVASVPYARYQYRHGFFPSTLSAEAHAELERIAREEVEETFRRIAA